MFVLTLALAMLTPAADDLHDAIAFFAQIRAAAASARYDQLRPLFVSPSYTEHLEEMVGPSSSLKSIGISAFPAPPGFEKLGKFWVVFHRYQEVEEDHDAVFPIVEGGDGLRLGRELPEDLATAYAIDNLDFDVDLRGDHANIHVTARLRRSADLPDTAVFRMNDAYRIDAAKYLGKPVPIIENKDLADSVLDKSQTMVLQSGGIFYLTNAGKGGELDLQYDASLDMRGSDKTTPDFAVLTSYWYPSISRGAAASTTHIEGPKEWLLLSNGNLAAENVDGDRKSVLYKNPVAVCFHEVVAGPYIKAYETQDRGRKFRAWQLTEDKTRAKHDAEMARDAVAFYEDRLGKFPFEGYDVVDTPDFYGVECYSFTILTPRITSWATSHEAGHTYFGGLVPNSYIHSIWNESLTQYIDSVQFKGNSDRSLNMGYATRNTKIALSAPYLPHGPFGDVGYYRGAYVMKMLENEIGLDKMNAALKKLVASRTGKLTEWSDIQKDFNDSTGQNLDWFFRQWVRGDTFPTVSIGRVFSERPPREGYETTVSLSQSGTPDLFNLKLKAILQTDAGEVSFPVEFSEKSREFLFKTPGRPRRLTLDPFGWTLASVPGPIPIRQQGPKPSN